MKTMKVNKSILQMLFKSNVAILVVLISLLLEENHAGAFNGEKPRVVPVEQLKEARQVLGSSLNYLNHADFPPWANLTLLEIGQRYFSKNYFGFMYSTAFSNLIFGSSTDALRIGISAGNTTERTKAMKRAVINALHFQYWASANLRDKDQRAVVFETLNTLHSVHAKVGLAAADNKNKQIFSKALIPEPIRGQNPYKIEHEIWIALDKDLRASSTLQQLRKQPIFPPKNGGTSYPLNQFAMALQIWGFVVCPVTTPKSVLFHDITDENLWGYIHFWAFIAHGMGIEEKYNVCLQPDLETAKAYYKRVLEVYFIPGLFELDYEYKVVMESSVKGLSQAISIIDFSLAIHRLCMDILHINCQHTKAVLTPQGRYWNQLLETFGHPLFNFPLIQTSFKFILDGLIQRATIRNFGFNPIFWSNFTNGLLQLDETILLTSDVYYNNDTKDMFINNLI